MNQQDILAQVDEAVAKSLALSAKSPNDLSLKKVLQALRSIREKVADHWPLTRAEKTSINIGIYAIRSMEGLYDDLVKRLTTLDQRLKSA